MITDEMRDKWKNQIEIIEGAFDVNQISFNKWEEEFFESIHDQVIYQNKDLSWKQSKALRKIYDKIG